MDAALRAFDQMATLATKPENLAAVGELFTRLNARMFFRFALANWGNRAVNRVSSGVVTFGATLPPIPLYDGPTGRRALSGRPDLQPSSREDGCTKLKEPQAPGQERDSLGNVSRGDKTAIELFLAGIRGWEACLRRRIEDRKPFSE